MITDKDIHRLSAYARIGLSEAEAKAIKKDLDDILGYVEKLKTFSGAGDKDEFRNVLRRDDAPHERGVFHDVLFASAPDVRDDFIIVKNVLERDEHDRAE